LARSGLNKSQVEQIARQQVQVMGVQTSYSGPLPPPELLEHFEKIIPGGADRIFAQFEAQTAHRQGLEAKVIGSNTFVQIFGAVSAFLLGLLAIGGGLFLVHEG
jgi:uncharacterized membrane protein